MEHKCESDPPTIGGLVANMISINIQLSYVLMACWNAELTFSMRSLQYPEWYPFIEATTATPFPGGEGDQDSRFRFVISIS